MSSVGADGIPSDPTNEISVTKAHRKNTLGDRQQRGSGERDKERDIDPRGGKFTGGDADIGTRTESDRKQKQHAGNQVLTKD